MHFNSKALDGDLIAFYVYILLYELFLHTPFAKMFDIDVYFWFPQNI